MKLTVRNLGRIDEATLDIRPLTVFVGANNTNKSWTAYAAFGLLGSKAIEQWMKLSSPYRSVPDHEQDDVVSRLLEGSGDLEDNSTHRVSLRREDHPDANRPDRFNVTAETLSNLLGIPVAALEQARVEAEAPLGEGALFDALDLQITRLGESFRIEYGFTGGKHEFRNNLTVKEAELREQVDRLVHILRVVRCWHAAVFPVNRFDLRRNHFLPESNAILANFRHTMSQAVDLEVLAPRAPSPEAQLLDRVMGGVVGGSKRGLTYTRGDVELGLDQAASMVRALAPLKLFLKSTARPGDWLVIDEPEMNLHPKAQLALTEFLAVLVNRGFNVLFTTHSPYMVEHLDTLMEGSRLDEGAQQRAATSFQLGEPEAFISPSKVAAYEFCEPDGPDGRVVVEDILDRDNATIETWTFGKVTEQLGALMNTVLEE